MLKHLPCSHPPGVRVKLSLPSEANRPLVPSWICSRMSDSSALLSSLVSSWLWLHLPLKTLGLVTLQGEMPEGLLCSCFLLLKGHSPAYPQAQRVFFCICPRKKGAKGRGVFMRWNVKRSWTFQSLFFQTWHVLDTCFKWWMLAL